MSKPRLAVSILEFDIEAIAEALHLTSAEAQAAFRDGRGAWPFSELWGQRLYEFLKHTNTNVPISDGAFALGQLGDATISVKALTRAGVKFQQSKDVGIGRKSTKEKLVAALESCDRVIVVDVTDFPSVRFMPIDTTRLLSAVHTDRLTTSGWKKSRLLNWLDETYTVSEIALTP